MEGGIAIYSKDRLRLGDREPASAWNGWNAVVHQWDPSRIADVSVVEAPGPINDWKHLVLRNGNRNRSVVIVEWERAAR